MASLMTAEFGMRHLDRMMAYSNRTTCMVCCVSLQSTTAGVIGVQQIISRCCKHDMLSNVPMAVSERLVEIISGLNNHDNKATEHHCSRCVDLLGALRFDSHENAMKAVLEAICDHASVRHHGTFLRYGRFRSLISVAHPLHQDFCDSLVRQLHGDIECLGTSTESAGSLLKFLESDEAPLVATTQGVQVLETYNQKLLLGGASTPTKVVFLHGLFRMLVQHNCGDVQTVLFQKYIGSVSHLAQSTTDLLTCVLAISKSNKDYFCVFGSDERTLSQIAQAMVQKENATHLLSDHQALKDLFMGVHGIQSPSLLSSVISQVVTVLGSSSEGFVLGSKVNMILCRNGALLVLKSHVLLPLLEKALDQWKPRDVEELSSYSGDDLRTMLDCLVMHSKFDDHLQHCHDLVTVFEEKFEKRAYSLQGYQRLSVRAATQSWRLLGDFTGKRLPTKETIEEHVQECHRLQHSLIELNTMVGTTLPTLLRRYNCVPGVGSKLAQLVILHRMLTSPINSTEGFVATEVCMVDLENFARQFRAEKQDCLGLLEYFFAISFAVLC